MTAHCWQKASFAEIYDEVPDDVVVDVDTNKPGNSYIFTEKEQDKEKICLITPSA